MCMLINSILLIWYTSALRLVDNCWLLISLATVHGSGTKLRTGLSLWWIVCCYLISPESLVLQLACSYTNLGQFVARDCQIFLLNNRVWLIYYHSINMSHAWELSIWVHVVVSVLKFWSCWFFTFWSWNIYKILSRVIDAPCAISGSLCFFSLSNLHVDLVHYFRLSMNKHFPLNNSKNTFQLFLGLPDSNGYIIVEANGGLNQQRQSVTFLPILIALFQAQLVWFLIDLILKWIFELIFFYSFGSFP